MKETIFADRFKQLFIRWILVIVPTVVIGYITLRFLNFSYTALNIGIVSQTFYFGLGLLKIEKDVKF